MSIIQIFLVNSLEMLYIDSVVSMHASIARMHVYRPVNLTLYLQRPIFICKTKLCCLIIFTGGTKITRNSVMFLSDQKLLFCLSKAPPSYIFPSSNISEG